MKLQNSILEKYGVDKALHFLASALFAALVSAACMVLFGRAGLIAGALSCVPAVLFLSVYKEARLDGAYDAKDVKASMLGVLFVLVFLILILWIKTLIGGS